MKKIIVEPSSRVLDPLYSLVKKKNQACAWFFFFRAGKGFARAQSPELCSGWSLALRACTRFARVKRKICLFALRA